MWASASSTRSVKSSLSPRRSATPWAPPGLGFYRRLAGAAAGRGLGFPGTSWDGMAWRRADQGAESARSGEFGLVIRLSIEWRSRAAETGRSTVGADLVRRAR